MNVSLCCRFALVREVTLELAIATRFGENKEDAGQAIAQATFADVYQPGY
jgi:hypothetical protein